MKKNIFKNSITGAVLVSMVAMTVAPFTQPQIGFANEIKQQKMTTQQKTTTKQKRNVMYYGDWSIWGGQGNFYPKDIPADQLTHLNFAFIDFDANGELQFTDKDAAVGAPVGQQGVQWGAPNAGILSALQQLRAENPNLKIGISVGGWSKSGDFSTVAADPVKRARLTKNLIKFIEYTNMDFIDLDWEYPGSKRQPDLIDNKNDEGTPNASPADKENFILLLQDIKSALDIKGAKVGKEYELSVAVHATEGVNSGGLDIPRLFNTVDFVNIMTYDLRGAWNEETAHQTPLYTNSNDPSKGKDLSIDESVEYFLKNGADPSKLVIGAAYYTRGWEKAIGQGTDANNKGLFVKAEIATKDADQTPSRGARNESALASGDGGRMGGIWSYGKLDALKLAYPGLIEYWDDTAKAPYLYNETTGAFFTYDNIRSVQEKAKYVNEKGLGGMIAWMASQDKATSGTKRDELTKATKQSLFGSSSLQVFDIVYSELEVSADVKTYEEAWSGKGYQITIKNNEKLEENSAVLKSVERASETIKAPKLYIKTDKALTSGDHMAGTVSYQNGYTVVDLKSVWEGKNIEPGQTYTFKLKGDVKIESIQIVQRMSDNSPEMYAQTIFGNNSTGGAIVQPEKNEKPIISGAVSKTIKMGDIFNALDGVTAFDAEDGDLTANIQVTGFVNNQLARDYTVTYKVTDSKNLETVVTIVIKVEAKVVVKPEIPTTEVPTTEVPTTEKPSQEKPSQESNIYDPTKIYNTGDKVIFKGKEYTAKWWVQGQNPDASDAWKKTSPSNSNGQVGEYNPKKVYNKGDKAIFKGEEYTAKWWVQGQNPNASGAWEKQTQVNSDGSIQYQDGMIVLGGQIVDYNGVKYLAKWWTNTTPGSDMSWKIAK